MDDHKKRMKFYHSELEEKLEPELGPQMKHFHL